MRRGERGEGERGGRLLVRSPPWASERYSSVLHREANWERKKAEGENDLGRAGQISPRELDGYELSVVGHSKATKLWSDHSVEEKRDFPSHPMGIICLC